MSLPSRVFGSIATRGKIQALQCHDTNTVPPTLTFIVDPPKKLVQIIGLLQTKTAITGNPPGVPPGVLSCIYDNDSDDTPQFVIEQGGTGNIAMQFLLSVGTTYTMGIDHSLPNDPFRITSGNSLSSSHILHLDSVAFNIGLGFDALDVIDTGTHNVAMGHSALKTLTAGGDNTAIGENSLLLATGDNNTAIGSHTGSSIVTGTGNILIGHEAGEDLTLTDSNNIVIGNKGIAGDMDSIKLGEEGTHGCTYLVGSQCWVDEQFETPVTGTIITADATKSVLIINPAEILATLTVNMPASPKDGQLLKIVISENITSMTHGNGGNILIGPFQPSIIAPASGTWYFRAVDNTWYPLDTVSAIGGGGGDVIGSPSSILNQVALFADGTGDLLKTGPLIISTTVAAFTDTHISLQNTGTAQEVRFYEPSSGGGNYVSFKSPALSTNINYTLPVDDGSAGNLLLTDGAGILSWFDESVYVLRDGTRVMTGVLSMGTDAGDRQDIDFVKELKLYGSDSGHISLVSPAAPTTYTFTLPTTTGSTGNFLQTNGSGVTSWFDESVYMLINGSRVMTGDLDMDDNDIISIKTIEFDGVTSGATTLTVPSVAGTFTLTLPDTTGTSGFVLRTDGAGITSWVDHGDLAGLEDNDHPQYILKTGDTMTGTLNMGTGPGDIQDIDFIKELKIRGITSGIVSIKTAASAGVHTLTLPTGSGTGSQVLSTNGTGVLSWVSHGGIAGVGNDDHPQYVLRDGTGVMTGALSMGTGAGDRQDIDFVKDLKLYGVTSGYVGLNSPATPTSYNITFPTSAGSANNLLQNNGSGVLSWFDESAYLFVDGTRVMTGALSMGTAPGDRQDIDFIKELKLHGSTSGVVTIGTATSAGTYSLTLPADDGANNEFLRTDGAGVLNWAVPSGVTDHGALTGLTDDDHTQYLLVNGSRAMTSTLNMGTNVGDRQDIDFIKGAKFRGLTSGIVTVSAAAIAGTHTLSLPTNGGVIGNVLITNGFGVLDWDIDIGQSTGVNSGGLLTVNGGDNTKFDISDGDGYIVNPVGGAKTRITWSGLTLQSTTYNGILTFVSMNSSSVPIYSTTIPTNAQQRDLVFLGVLIHVNSVNIDTTNDQQTTMLNPTNQIRDFMEAIGFVNVSGNKISGNSLLTMTKTEGTLLKFGANYKNDIKNPHVITLPAIDTNIGGGSPNIFQYRYQDASSGALTDVNIIPGEYDDGNGQASPGTVGVSQWTIQRFYSFTSNNLKIQPGQFLYNSLEAAEAAIASEAFITESSIVTNGILIGFLIVVGNATDLTDPAQAHFENATRFGEIPALGDANVVGPTVTTNNTLARFDGTSGTVLLDSVLIVDDSGHIDKDTGSPVSFLHERGGAGNFSAGSAALDAVTAGGTNNTALGQNALGAVTTEDGNTAVGFNALVVNTSNDNTAIGASALVVNTSGNNTAVGARSLDANVGGTLNTAVGVDALGANISGNNNTAVGDDALLLNTANSNSTAIGKNSLAAATGGTNTAVGSGAGSALTTGTGNILVGYNAGSSLATSDTGNIDIGHVGVAGDSNKIRIGTSQTNTFIQGIHGVTPGGATQTVKIDSNGELGSEIVSASGFDSYTFITVSSSPYTVLNTDNVIGIDTSSIAITITLPAISSCGKKQYIIADTAGDASGQNITINANVADLINGSVSYVLQGDYNSATLVNDDGTNWIIC